MILIVAVGLRTLAGKLVLEVFPDIAADKVVVEVSYRGATPSEVEDGVVIRIEEAIQDLVGIEEIISTAAEGQGTVTVEVAKGFEPRDLLDDIKNRVDAITTFPDEIERPSYRYSQRRMEVISVVVSGALPEDELRRVSERVRDDILDLPGITQAALTGVRPYEISIDIDEETLQRHQLTFDDIAVAVRRSSLDLPAGSIKTDGGEILLRTKEQSYTSAEFARIPIIVNTDGVRLTLGDIATIHDGFEEEPLFAWFDGQPCVVIDIQRVGDQNAITIANTVKDYIDHAESILPPGVKLDYWRDRSKIVKSRLRTLIVSAAQGGVLVFLLLAMFLRFTVALWVCIGIPVAFMGAIITMPFTGVTINIISLFAFILVLGIVVDDAIVTGENIYTRLRAGSESPTDAAILGTQEVSVPVTFGVLTTVAAFLPLLMMGGERGAIMAQIPMIVIPVLIFSLIESKLILPAHLKHMRVEPGASSNPFRRFQRRIADGLEAVIRTYYQPLLSGSLRRRYVVFAIFVGFGILVISTVISGRMRFLPFPRVQSEMAQATLEMPLGTPFATTRAHVERITAAAAELQQRHIDPGTGESIITGMMSLFGTTGPGSGQSHLGSVLMEIMPPESRRLTVTSSELVREWRELIGVIPGAGEVSFRAEIGHGGQPIDVQLTGTHFEHLVNMSDEVKVRMGGYAGVYDISDSFQGGKEEIKLTLKPKAELLGVSAEMMAKTVRDAFFGREVQRIQRGRNDVRVMVRYPRHHRESLANLASMRILTPAGDMVPFNEIATLDIGRSYSTIRRVDRNRTVNVTADVNKDAVDIRDINRDMTTFLHELKSKYPDVHSTLEGEAKDQRNQFASLFAGLFFTLFAVYALLAIPFRSYSQPAIVMSVIPFGLIGAILGHFIMGMPLSMMSIFGILALSGIVVNDSLVLVDYINRRRREGMALADAVSAAGVARFRAILLTSLTTFCGLMPLIFEKSTQAQFLIPMAVSLGFGILFATAITLLLIPINYMILDDIRRWVGWQDSITGVPFAGDENAALAPAEKRIARSE